MARRIALVILAVSLASCAFAVTVDQIRLERHHCFGWCPVDELVLPADGSAEYSGLAFVKRSGDYVRASARRNSTRSLTSSTGKGFEGLPAAIGGDGFDAPWEVVSVSREGVTKSVTAQHYDGTTSLNEVVKRLTAFGASLPWKAIDSGVDAQVLAGWMNRKPRPPSNLQLRYTVDFAREGALAETYYALEPDAAGRLFLPLRPGTYTVNYYTAKQTLVVRPHTFSRETLVFVIEPPQR